MAFRAKKRISERAAHNMTLAMALHGNHYNDIHDNLRNADNVKEHFRQNGMNFAKEVSKCRDFSRPVPMYENLISSQMTVRGATISRINPETNQYEKIISGDGTVNDADYWAVFDIAIEDFNQAIITGRYERLLSAINAGISAIETFLNHQYIQNMGASADILSLRSNLDNKIDTWIPLFTSQEFDKSKKMWQDFCDLRDLRNENFQHIKSMHSGITYEDLLKIFNRFKSGICLMLYTLHTLFNVRCPGKIIRYTYFPEIEFVSEKD